MSATLDGLSGMYRTQSIDTDRATGERLFDRYRQMSATENRLRLLSRRVDRETMIRLYGWDPEVKGR